MKEESGTYGASKKTRHIVEGPGRLKRATIAVLINDRPQGTGHGTAVSQVPWTPDQMKRITQLAQAAVGYDASRGDVISVENLAFDSAPDMSESIANRALNTAQSLDLPRYGAALLGLLALILLVIRPVTRSLRAGSVAGPRRPDLSHRCAAGGDRARFTATGKAPSRSSFPKSCRQRGSGYSSICAAVAHVA